VQHIAGCAGGALAGGLAATPLATCGGGAYAFRFETAAAFEASAVTGLSLDVHAGVLDASGLPTVVSCDVGDGGERANACLDFTNLVDPLVPFRFTRVSAVPEPGAAVLLAAGLGALVAIRARPRRAILPNPIASDHAS
jgi:hypothetical protein